ncbi:MAG: Flp pilus assembly protein CpaB [Nitrosomonadales bacterium]|nr:MAG: Flp pilus assembly protein CpaB [Nitrosomonadales bacterium]
MKNVRALVVLLVAIAAGGTAMFMAKRWVAEHQPAQGGGVQVAVAAKQLDLGTALTPELIRMVGWPKESVPDGSFTDSGKLAGRVIKMNVQAGEPILEAKLAPVGAAAGLSSLIPEGSRAMTVSVNEIIGVAGFALPGNYVDILVNTQDEKSRDPSKQISKIVLERIKVLAVAQEASTDQTKPKVVSAVTLEVKPEEAEKIDLARSVGTLTLVLRNQVDLTPASTTGARKPELLSGSTAPAEAKAAEHPAAQAAEKPVVKVKRAVAVGKPKPAAAPATVQIEVIRGTERSTGTFKTEKE